MWAVEMSKKLWLVLTLGLSCSNVKSARDTSDDQLPDSSSLGRWRHWHPYQSNNGLCSAWLQEVPINLSLHLAVTGCNSNPSAAAFRHVLIDTSNLLCTKSQRFFAAAQASEKMMAECQHMWDYCMTESDIPISCPCVDQHTIVKSINHPFESGRTKMSTFCRRLFHHFLTCQMSINRHVNKEQNINAFACFLFRLQIKSWLIPLKQS